MHEHSNKKQNDGSRSVANNTEPRNTAKVGMPGVHQAKPAAGDVAQMVTYYSVSGTGYMRYKDDGTVTTGTSNLFSSITSRALMNINNPGGLAHYKSFEGALKGALQDFECQRVRVFQLGGNWCMEIKVPTDKKGGTTNYAFAFPALPPGVPPIDEERKAPAPFKF